MEYQCSYFPGLDREYSSLLLIVPLTLILAVLGCMMFLRQGAMALEGLIWELPGDQYMSMPSDGNWTSLQALGKSC